MRKVIVLFGAISLLLSTSGHTAETKQAQQERPKIGVVLGGGGARGIAHIGVLRVLEENNIPIDYIAGTSMGSIVAGLYASGISLDKLEEIIARIDWLESFGDRTEREDRTFRRKLDDRLYLIENKPGFNDGEIQLPGGLLQGQRINLLLTKLTLPVAHIHDFNNLQIPYRAVAADLTTGEAVVLDKGILAQAMRASMNIPAIFSPVEVDGRLLVDGFVANNVPIDVARNMGADIIIAVDVGTPLRKKDELDSPLAVADQITGILSVQNTKRQVRTLTDKDVLIVPDLGDIGAGDFDIAGEGIPPGAEAANAQLDKLRRYSLSKTEYVAFRETQQVDRQPPPTVAFIRVDNDSNLSDDAITSRLNIKTGDPLDVEQLELDIAEIYGFDLFENINYSVVEENGETGIEIHAKEKSWGPNYIQFGIAASNDLEGDSVFNVAAAYTRTNINTLGGEWRTALQIGEDPGLATEIYQPLDTTQTYFINPLIFIESNNVNLFGSVDEQVAEYRLTRYGVRLEAGRNFGTWGELRFGYSYEDGDADLRVGDPSLEDFDFEDGLLMARFTIDRLDNANFPQDGYYSRLEYRYYDEDLGGDTDYDQFELDTIVTHSWGKDTLFAGLRYFTTLDDDAPIQGLFRAGGFVNLSGFNQNELSGQHFGIARVGYQRRINDFQLVPAYLGAIVEYGNVWQDEDDIFDDNLTAGTVYLGLDTPIGPIYGAYGYAEGGNDSLYLFVGRVF